MDSKRAFKLPPTPGLLLLIITGLWGLSTWPATAFDAVSMQLYKGVIFDQYTNGAPTLATNSPYVFQAIIVPLFPHS
jgi:hypothetical protein